MTSDPLVSIMEAGRFEPFIRHIRFPRFKNLAPDQRLGFCYPITALVGANGTNKSSILRALQACPAGENIGDHWFDTKLDRIDVNEEEGLHRYVHGYRLPTGREVEVIKSRIGNRSRGPDYFETARLRPRDGGDVEMPEEVAEEAPYRSKTRWKPIEKNVEYLDFRQELPAYDIFMHFGGAGKTRAEKKSRVRRAGKHLAAALDGQSAKYSWYGADRIAEPAIVLGNDEVAAISRILGREYSCVELIQHTFFDGAGYTARLRTGQQAYSEAFAGSGEFAAVMIVHRVLGAPRKSLILLDEPETSLHPEAQAKLLEFLRGACKTRKHQVVMATHSSAMIGDLPRGAIKVLDLDPASERVVVVSDDASPAEAFARLGHVTATTKTVIVEDQLAAEFVRTAARTVDSSFLDSFDIHPFPGGSGRLLAVVAPSHALVDARHTVLMLDGDQRWDEAIPEEQTVADADVIKTLEGFGIARRHLPQNSDSPEKEQQLRGTARVVLDWLRSNVRFLPGDDCPEGVLLEMLGEGQPASPAAAKQWWVDQARVQLGLGSLEQPDAGEILDTQRRALATVVEHPNIKLLADQLRDVFER